MTPETANPPFGAAGAEMSLLGGSDGSANTKPGPAAQAAIADLRRDFIAECLRIASVKAAHGADNIALGDDLTAGRDIRLAVENIREAARSFREWQAVNEAVPAEGGLP